MNTATIALLAFWLIFMTVLYGQGKIKSLFALRDGRAYMSETTYGHLGKLMETGEMFISSHNYTLNGVEYYATYKVVSSRNESSELKLSGANLDKLINDLYALALARGYVN